MLLNEADALFYGVNEVDKAFLAGALVWPPPLPFSGALAKKAADHVGVNYSGGVLLTWDGVDVYDTHNFHDPVVNNTKLIVPASMNGYYGVITVMVDTADFVINGENSLRLKKNGNFAFTGASGLCNNTGPSGTDNSGTKSWLQCSTHPILLATGDEFEAWYDTSTVDTAVTIVAATSSFGIRIIGASIVGALVKKSADLSGNYTAGGPMPFDAEVYDTHGFHDNSVNPSRFTIPSIVSGKYGIIKASMSLTGVSTNVSIGISIWKNGAVFQEGGLRTSHNQTTNVVLCEVESQPVLLQTGDYYEVNYSHSTDTVTVITAAESFFSIEVITIPFAGALAKKATSQLAANYTTPTTVVWDGADVYDTDDAHDPVFDNTKIIIPPEWDGLFGIFTAQAEGLLFTINQSVSVAIEKNGSASYPEFGGFGGHASGYSVAWKNAKTQPVQLNTGDQYTAKFWFGVDTSITLSAQSTFGVRVFNLPVVDLVAPTIMSANTARVGENLPLAFTLVADEGAAWAVVGGADAAKFEITATAVLRFASNAVKDFEAPDDADANAIYDVVVRATDLAGNVSANQTIAVSVIDTPDGVIATFASDWNVDPSLSVVVPWTAETLDTHGAHDPAGANTKIIIPAAFNGKYGVFHAQLGVTGTPSGVGVSMWITKNGSAAWIGNGGQGKNAGNVSNIASTWCATQPVLLATGEEYEVVLNSTDTAVLVRSTLSHFSLEIVG